MVNDTSTTPYDIIIAFTCTRLYNISELMILGNLATHEEKGQCGITEAIPLIEGQ